MLKRSIGSAPRLPAVEARAAGKGSVLIFATEADALEIVGNYEVLNVRKARAIAAARRREARKRKQIAKAGLTMAQAIERALRGKRKRGAAS
jgi:hypothetical protein